MSKEVCKRRWTQNRTVEPANAENILKNRGVVKRQQTRKRQEILCLKHWTDACTQETAKIENILKTRRKSKLWRNIGNVNVTVSV